MENERYDHNVTMKFHAGGLNASTEYGNLTLCSPQCYSDS